MGVGMARRQLPNEGIDRCVPGSVRLAGQGLRVGKCLKQGRYMRVQTFRGQIKKACKGQRPFRANKGLFQCGKAGNSAPCRTQGATNI